jgi:hypothetical protein
VKLIPDIVKMPAKKVCAGITLVAFWSLMGPALAVALWRYQRDQAAACKTDKTVVQ